MQIVLLFMIFCSCSLLKQSASEMSNHCIASKVKVFAAVLPPFTYFDTNYGFYDGVDILLLKTIAKRLNLKLILTKADILTHIPVSRFE